MELEKLQFAMNGRMILKHFRNSLVTNRVDCIYAGSSRIFFGDAGSERIMPCVKELIDKEIEIVEKEMEEI